MTKEELRRKLRKELPETPLDSFNMDLAGLIDSLEIKDEITPCYPRTMCVYSPDFEYTKGEFFDQDVAEVRVMMDGRFGDVSETTFVLGPQKMATVIRSQDNVYAISIQKKVDGPRDHYWQIRRRSNVEGTI